MQNLLTAKVINISGRRGYLCIGRAKTFKHRRNSAAVELLVLCLRWSRSGGRTATGLPAIFCGTTIMVFRFADWYMDIWSAVFFSCRNCKGSLGRWSGLQGLCSAVFFSSSSLRVASCTPSVNYTTRAFCLRGAAGDPFVVV